VLPKVLMLSRKVEECKPLMGGAQFGAPGAKAALARFDALAAAGPARHVIATRFEPSFLEFIRIS